MPIGGDTTTQALANGKKNGRPLKLSDKFLDTFEEYVKEAKKKLTPAFIALTEQEMLETINYQLKGKPEHQISVNKWIEYKNKMPLIREEREKIERFRGLYKEILLKQKQLLLDRLANCEPEQAKYWQRFAWILERKFEDYNLRQLQDVKTQSTIIYQSLDNAPQVVTPIIDINESEEITASESEGTNRDDIFKKR